MTNFLFKLSKRLSASARRKQEITDDLKCAGGCNPTGNPLYTVRDTVPPPPLCVCEDEAVSHATQTKKPD